MVKFI